MQAGQITPPLPHFPSSLLFLSNQPGQICGAQRAVCVFVCLPVCVNERAGLWVSMSVCVPVSVCKILGGRLESEIGNDNLAARHAFPTIQ